MKYLIIILAFASCDYKKDKPDITGTIDSSMAYKNGVPYKLYYDSDNPGNAWYGDACPDDTIIMTERVITEYYPKWVKKSSLIDTARNVTAITHGDNSPAVISSEPVKIEYK